jgi:NAD(P)-dependent dehydrogenase (short-subunit alcohol dehydrogenase family)
MPRPLEECDDQMIDTVIDVNLKAPIRLAREAVRHMQRGSVIVHVGSVGGLAAQYQAAAYSASKAGLEMLTRALALELAERGIRVVGVAPGDIKTYRDAGAHQARNSEGFKRYGRVNPLSRRGRPEDVAQAVSFLVSPSAAYITGTTLVVDGGRLTY